MTEIKQTVSSVEILPTINNICVLWTCDVFVDGVLLNSFNKRTSYSQGMRDAFISEVDSYINYVDLINWEVPIDS